MQLFVANLSTAYPVADDSANPCRIVLNRSLCYMEIFAKACCASCESGGHKGVPTYYDAYDSHYTYDDYDGEYSNYDYTSDDGQYTNHDYGLGDGDDDNLTTESNQYESHSNSSQEENSTD